MTGQALINELLHRITLAETREVRMQLCAEIKAEMAKLLEQEKAAN